MAVSAEGLGGFRTWSLRRSFLDVSAPPVASVSTRPRMPRTPSLEKVKPDLDLSHNLNSFKGLYKRLYRDYYMGLLKGDTGSSDPKP